MKIAVCIKQVPIVSMLKFDNETRRVVREGVPNEVNPFDMLAVSLAVGMKENRPTEVVVYTMVSKYGVISTSYRAQPPSGGNRCNRPDAAAGPACKHRMHRNEAAAISD